MFIFKILACLCLILGLVGTFIHRIPGAPLIVGSAVGYAFIRGIMPQDAVWLPVLLGLTLGAELGGTGLKNYILSRAGIDKSFGLNVAAGILTSLVITNILAGPLLGLFVWDLLIGKSFMPSIKRGGLLVLQLCLAAAFRFSIAFAMSVIVIFKIL